MIDMPYLDVNLPIQSRVGDLLKRLTIDEKAGQLIQYFHPTIAASVADEHEASVLSRNGRNELDEFESRIISGRVGSVLFIRDVSVGNRLQRLAVEQSRLGIPLLFGFDVIHGFRTVFPVPIGIAASWRPQNAEDAQAIAAREARAVGIHWTFAPMIDITRDPRWGRIVEGAGEDPVLGAAFASAQVRGFQGELGPDSILAGPKHFIGYGASRGGRDYEEADISDSELYNVYLPPFRAAVQAGAVNVMSAYMELNGVPAAANAWLLRDLLRGELGFQGFVVSDANAVSSLAVQHFVEDAEQAAIQSIEAGLDMEMTLGGAVFSHLPAAVASGALDESLVDAAVARVLAIKFQLGLFETPYADEHRSVVMLGAAAHRETARHVAEESLVLLKNKSKLLPLKPTPGQRIAVIGELADSKRDSLGPWTFAHRTDETVTVLEGLRARIPSDVELSFAPGARIPQRIFPSIFERIDPQATPTAGWDDDAEISRAIEVARGADVVVVVVGQRQDQIGEKSSVSTLNLPGRQLEQLQRISETGASIVLLVMSGRPLDLSWADENVPAIAQIWYPGSRGGDAIAAVLLGDTSPAGRLPFTWPRHVGQVPIVYSHYRSFSPQDASERYFNEVSNPLYCFGYGLSYARFEYSNLRLANPKVKRGEGAAVIVDVTNVSDVDSDEVVQLYVHQRFGRAVRPVRELKGFQRIFIQANQSRSVTFQLEWEHLRYWSAADRAYVQDETVFDVWVGGHSGADLAVQLVVSG